MAEQSGSSDWFLKPLRTQLCRSPGRSAPQQAKLHPSAPLNSPFRASPGPLHLPSWETSPDSPFDNFVNPRALDYGQPHLVQNWPMPQHAPVAFGNSALLDIPMYPDATFSQGLPMPVGNDASHIQVPPYDHASIYGTPHHHAAEYALPLVSSPDARETNIAHVPGKRRRSNIAADSGNGQIACLFYKRDRIRYEVCRKFKFASVMNMKQHLLRDLLQMATTYFW
ncbi:uncharacterized protein PG986_002913 [Apiospora aurea]|uniref:Uncharacterized protein n=1 Tax=Apiospora aurea TaxID=335848 RepID=A0ABR1QQ61_9PEZI